MVSVTKSNLFRGKDDWLVNSLTPSEDGYYHHRKLEEQLESRLDAIEELKAIVYRAHEDARNCIRNTIGIENSLDPWGEKATPGTEHFSIESYPKKLPINTLKGYFGEIFAGLIAENFSPFEQEWEVPVFLFRYHELAFDCLDQMRQGITPSEHIVGRHGDDCLAFQRNDNGKIIRSLSCEAKCTLGHEKGMINDAHIKASSQVLVPTSFNQIIKVMSAYSDEDSSAAAWVDALRQLYLVNSDTADYERCDLVSYICGLPPVRTTTEIIPTLAPHKNYTGGRRLEAVETHLHDVEGLVGQVYEIDDNISSSMTDLTPVWHSILEHVKPDNTKHLYLDQCQLVDVNPSSFIVEVSSLEKFRDALRNQEKLQEAFIAAGLFTPIREKQKNPKVRFKCRPSMNTAQTNTAA